MRVACIGGAHFDAKAHALGQVRPGTSNPARVVHTPGGVACNVARNLGRLGLPVTLFSAVGEDPWGRLLLGDLHAAAVDTSGVRRAPGPPTGSYLAVLNRDGDLVVAVADMEIYETLDPSWAAGVGPLLAEFDAWVVDANLPAPTLARLIGYAGEALVVADPVSVAKAARLVPALSRIDVVFPDRAEALVLGGLPAGDEVSVSVAAAAVRRRGVRTVVVSLGAAGAYFDDGGTRGEAKALAPRRMVDVTGAGDAQIAGYVYGVSVGGHPPPIAWAMAAASLTVETIDSVRGDLTPALLRDRLDGRR